MHFLFITCFFFWFLVHSITRYVTVRYHSGYFGTKWKLTLYLEPCSFTPRLRRFYLLQVGLSPCSLLCMYPRIFLAVFYKFSNLFFTPQTGGDPFYDVYYTHHPYNTITNSKPTIFIIVFHSWGRSPFSTKETSSRVQRHA